MNELIIGGVPAVLLAFGLTEFAKKFGASGNVLTGLSAFFGLAVSAGYQLAAGIPTTPSGWVQFAVVGLAYGLTASGVYDFVNSRLPAPK